jgi:outer membrane receptor protein involved in Fe transport
MLMSDEIAPNASYVNVNMDKTLRIGTTVAASFRPVPFAELKGGYSYVQATFVDGTNEGKDVPLVPRQTAQGSLEFSMPFGFRFGPDVSYTGKAFRGGILPIHWILFLHICCGAQRPRSGQPGLAVHLKLLHE